MREALAGLAGGLCSQQREGNATLAQSQEDSASGWDILPQGGGGQSCTRGVLQSQALSTPWSPFTWIHPFLHLTPTGETTTLFTGNGHSGAEGLV